MNRLDQKMNIHKIKRLFLLSLTAYFLMVNVNCAEDKTKGVPVNGNGSYYSIGADTLKGMIEKKDFLFINVHIPYEGEIEGTDLFIPYNEIQKNLNKFPSDKDAKIVLPKFYLIKLTNDRISKYFTQNIFTKR